MALIRRNIQVDFFLWNFTIEIVDNYSSFFFSFCWSFFKGIDYEKPEFVHKSVKYSQKIEKNHLNSNNNKALNNSGASSISTLEDCFELFTEQEELTDENSWFCPNCRKQTNAYKKLCISEVPPILIIHLKRFFYKVLWLKRVFGLVRSFHCHKKRWYIIMA